jgi:hypothetical protein
MRSHGGFVGITFELGSSTWTGEDEDGYPIAQHDGQGQNAGGIAAEIHHPFGFMSKPLDPERDPSGEPIPGKSCNVLIGKIGHETHLWYAFDPRIIPKLPVLKKGGAVFYCAHGSFRVFDGDDGTETAYFPVPGNKAHVSTMGLDGQGKPFVAIEHCDGMAVTMLEHSLTLKNANGSVYIEIKDDRIVFNGNEVHNGGATFGDPVGALPAAIAPNLVAYLNALEADITSAFTAVLAGTLANGALGATKFGTTSAPARAALMAQIAALKTSIS